MRKTLLFSLLLLVNFSLFSQNKFQDGLTISEQWEFIKQKSSRWENYSMIQDPWLNNIKSSVLDSLDNKNKMIAELNSTINKINIEKEELTQKAENIKQELEKTKTEKNNFEILNISMNKSVFVSIISFTFLGLLIFTAFSFLLFKRENMNMSKCKKENEQLKQEFEDYRQETRIKQEQLVIQHHKEIQKLKGMG